MAKDKTTAALFCFFLGGVSAHRFYVGKVRSALAQAALSVVGSIVLFASFMVTVADPMADSTGGSVVGLLLIMFAGVWILTDFVMILLGRFTDGKGYALGVAKPVAGRKAPPHPISASNNAFCWQQSKWAVSWCQLILPCEQG